MNFSSTVRGCLMAGALGDSFGYLIERDDLASIKNRFGNEGLLDLSQSDAPVHFSDDTQLTLFTLDGLIEAIDWANQGIAADHLACLWLAYLRWLRTQGEQIPENAPQPPRRWLDQQQVLLHRRDPGKACLSSLLSGDMGTIQKPIAAEAKGCGSVMRSAPFGLIPHLDAELAARMSLNAAALTHGHPVAYQASAAFSWLIHQLAVKRLSLAEAMTSMKGYLETLSAESVLLGAVQDALRLASEQTGASYPAGAELSSALGLGWVAEEALALACYCALVTEPEATSPTAHYLTAIRVAANHDGDSDSVAAITGNILGAHYGEACLPTGWLLAAEAPELIYAMADEFVRVTGSEAS
ncbi:ADP-ribosylglycohydrolase family protein [Psychromicrobium lacuslunae]|uniref:Crystallin n=1 Tax=Psychromicrobium lacuslunae TaxID=1618207 RepID=A0A0D4BYA8_9MICC|nr:ADP-ribosylglycohydrolase family protein [Psychromicrobium lacuslunae]AJT41318.1 crystallin [Psychromicrobium lacuslunae]